MAWALAMIRGKEYGKGHDLHNDDIIRSMITTGRWLEALLHGENMIRSTISRQDHNTMH